MAVERDEQIKQINNMHLFLNPGSPAYIIVSTAKINSVVLAI
jgi:hypothetical protein